MSAALYIVLQTKIPGFDAGVGGKALGRAGKLLDGLAKRAGVKPLMEFFSASPEDMMNVLGDMASSEHIKLPAEKWFAAEEGLTTIRTLRNMAKAESIDNLERIAADLDEFERVLVAAEQHGVCWHLAVDY